ncbi:MFS transporter [Pantoea ananatis]|uniref:MFS transporter n=1 Tax=Pantoea ananas TaxID=553 RepID=UPI001FF14D25|nr:MFS transporter [Pantoea ananatis]MCK0552660.1 MFS transporter [Pantoea ananatis]
MSAKLHIILLTTALFIGTFAVNLQTPLYGAYAAKSGVGATAVTLAFAAYVAGLMPTLLFLGGLSDRIGRRIPVAVALALGVLATALLVIYPNWVSLFFARVLLGIGTGLITTAGTAYMSELMAGDASLRAPVIVTSATSLGFGSGALATSISIKFQGETLLPVSFIIFFVIALTVILLMKTMPPTLRRREVSLFRLPFYPVNTAVYGLAMAAAWATTGMIIAVIPLELARLKLSEYSGLVVFLAIFVGFLCQPVAKKCSKENALSAGMIMTALGFLVILSGAWTASVSLILIGTGITSASSYGFTYLSSLSAFSMMAGNEKARATAGLFVYAYIGFSLPVIASGALADKYGLEPAITIFSAFQIVTVVLILLLIRKKIK